MNQSVVQQQSNRKEIERRSQEKRVFTISIDEGGERKWKEIIGEGILEEIRGRESLGELNLVEKSESKYNPGMMVVSKENFF